MSTIKFDRFLGINTKLPDYGLTSTDRRQPGRWLRDAVNVDFRNDGSIVRRRSFDLIGGTNGAHSIFEDLLVRDGQLYRFTLSPYTQTFVKLLSTNSPMSYCRIGDSIYMSNGVDALRMRNNGEVVSWAVPAPAAPIVTQLDGELSPGRYGVQMAYCTDEGEEGVLSEVTWVETGEVLSGGFRVALPPEIANAAMVSVYITGNDGAVPLLAASVPCSDITLDIVARPTGRQAHRRIESALPAGTKLFNANGRLCSVSGNRIWFSVPYRAGYCEAGSGYVEFESDVKIAVCAQNGVYVAAGNTHFLRGSDIAKAEFVQDVLNYSAVPGTEFEHPDKPLVGWFGDDGLVLAGPDGSVEELMADKVEVSAPGRGHSLITHNREMTIVVSCGWAVNLSSGAVSRYDEMILSSNDDVAATASGLVTFGDSPVDAVVDFGQEDFKTENEKFMPTAYIGAASDGPLALNITLDGETYSYDARGYSERLNIERIDPAKGLRSNWFNLALVNPEGVDFELASIYFAPAASTRRI